MEIYAHGFGFLEAPCWHDGRLIVADVTGGGVHAVDADGRARVLIPKRRGIGGIVSACSGGIVVTGRNVSHVRGDQTDLLLQVSGIAGFNDLTTTPTGQIIVGALADSGLEKGDERRPGDVYLIDRTGSARVLYADVSLANGIALAAGSGRLLHSDSGRHEVIVHDWDGERATGRRRFFAPKAGTPDGIALDVDGGLWVACYDACVVVRLDEHGHITEQLDVPSHQVTSVCFGGPESTTLFITTGSNSAKPDLNACVFAHDSGVAGAPIADAAI